MKRTLAALTLSLFLVTAPTGCLTGITTPVFGGIYTNVKAPADATSSTAGFSKVGASSCMSILGWIAVGDASIDAAVKNGGITKIHHVDYESMTILGIYSKVTTLVYGD